MRLYNLRFEGVTYKVLDVHPVKHTPPLTNTCTHVRTQCPRTFIRVEFLSVSSLVVFGRPNIIP